MTGRKNRIEETGIAQVFHVQYPFFFAKRTKRIPESVSGGEDKENEKKDVSAGLTDTSSFKDI